MDGEQWSQTGLDEGASYSPPPSASFGPPSSNLRPRRNRLSLIPHALRAGLPAGSLPIGRCDPSSPTSSLDSSQFSDSELRESFHSAMYHGSVADIRRLLIRKNLRRINDPLNRETDGKLPILVAATRGEKFVELMLDSGADVDGSSAFNGTALQCAAEQADFDTVKLLIERGANVNAKPGYRGTALIAASRAGSLEVARYLLKHHADPNAVDGYRFASALSVAPNFAMLDLLLKHGADVKKKSRDSHALIKAVKRNDEASVALLLQYGADPNMPVARTGSLICIAIENNFLGVLDLLLQAGANVNNHRGVLGPPILTAANTNSKEAVGLLLSYGSQIPDFGNMNDSDISPILRIWHRAAKDYSYEDLDELKRDLTGADATGFIRRSRFEWDIPHLKDEIGTALGRQEVTMTTQSADRCTKTRARVSDYLRCKWGSLGTQILNDIEQVLSPERGFWLRNSCYIGEQLSVIYHLSAEQSSLSLDIGFAASESDLLSCIEAVDWLCRAVRSPPRGLWQGAFSSSSKCKISRCGQDDQSTFGSVSGRPRADSEATSRADKLELQLDFSLRWKALAQVRTGIGGGAKLAPSGTEKYVLEEKEEEPATSPASAGTAESGRSGTDSGGQRSPSNPNGPRVRWNLRER